MIAELVFIVLVGLTPSLESPWRAMCAATPPYVFFVVGCFMAQIFGYFLACFPYILLDAFGFERFKVQSQVPHPTVYQTIRASFDTLMSFVNPVLPMLGLGGLVIEQVGILRNAEWPSRGVLVTQIAYFFLVEDYLNYWLHRWLHQPWLYRRIHSVHHTYDAPFAVTAAYAHPAEVVILAIPTFAGPALLLPHMYTLFIWQLMRNCEAIDIHSGYELPFSIKSIFPAYAGTAHHDYHHYMHSGNFASVFTWCDRLYGTHLGYQNFIKKNKQS